ncbi:MAG: hypothetical protein M1819_000957 [Sarea resinae]|nr:MAG: hypothetical protein M1819_000957 [Sarea resinae]
MYSTGGIYGSGYFNGTSGSAGPSVGPVGFSTGPGMVIPTGSPVGTGKYPSYGTGYYYPTDKGTGSIPFATGKMSTGTETPSASAVLASTGSGKPSGAGVNYTYHPSGTGPKYTYKPSGTSKPLPSGFQPGGPIKNITSHVPYPTGSGVAISGYNPGGPIMNITTTVHKVSTVHISPTPASGLPSGAKNISSSPSAGGVAAIGSGLGYYPIPSSSKPYSGSLLSSSPVLASPVSGSGSSSYPTASGAISTSPTTSSDKDKTTPYTGQKTASSPMASATGSGSSPIPSSAGAVGISSSEESSSSSTPTVTSTGGIKITISTVHPVPTEYYYHHRRPKHHGHHEPDYGYGESSDDYGYGSEPTEDEGGYGYGGYGYFK